MVAAAVAYTAGFLAFYPDAVGVTDEASYLRQAVAFSHGETSVEERDALRGGTRRVPPSFYPIGTSALQAPFVALWGGWRGGYLLSLLSVLATLAILARWMADTGHPAAFALVPLAFPPFLVLGRHAMSDVPSAALVALGLWLFWRGADPRLRLAAGLVAGASLVFRETNVLLFAPFFAGAIVRRERGSTALVAGSIAGASLQVLSSWAVFGDPFFVRQTEYGWSLDAVWRNAPLYLASLTIPVPLGLVAALLYRGERRAELLITTSIFVGFYLAYDYGAHESGPLKRIVLGPRFFVPLLPLLCLALADGAARLGGTWQAPRITRLFPHLARAWAAALVVAAAAVHPVMSAWGESRAAISSAIYESTDVGAVLVTNLVATGKWLHELYGDRAPVDRNAAPPSALLDLRAGGPLYLVFLDRSDSDSHRSDAQHNARYATEAERLCRIDPVLDRAYTATERLRIWRVESCGG